jgi:inosine triphosphate pyrophosphatase
MKHIIFLTENANKYKELVFYLDNISELQGKISIEMVKPDYELHEIQSMNRSEIVRNKLETAIRHNANFLNLHADNQADNQENKIEKWIMVEDTSLCIEKQGGFPGPFIKYYLQSLSLNTIANNNWGSKAYSYVNLAIGKVVNAICINNILITKEFEGSVVGQIVEPKGDNGFGFDPIFRPDRSNFTNAQMSMEEKALFNPRTKAFQSVIDYLCN